MKTGTEIQPVVLVEQVSIDEEVDFYQAVDAAVERGEISAEDAIEMIDRQFDLWSAAK